jgi:hypothetical protein
MANVFTALAPILFSAADTVSKEDAGALDAISLDFDNKGVAIGDVVKVPIAPAAAVSAYTPSMSPSAGTDKTAEAVSVTITANAKTDWHLTGEQVRSLQNAESDKEWLRLMIAEGMRALRNAAEADAIAAINVGASRAFGTAGTTPFASDLSALTNIRKILKDNGCPLTDPSVVFNSDAGLNLRNLNIYQQAAMAGSDAERRSGNFLRQYGFAMRESAGISSHTAGAGSAYVTSGATAAGVTDIALVTGSGTVLAGDVVTFAADTANKYVIGSGITAPGTISLNKPGARKVIPTANAMTIGSSYVPNLAFERSSVVGVFRAPDLPENPTMKKMQISDENGMVYTLVEIVGDGMTTWRLHAAWGFKVVKPEHVAILLG